MGEAGLNLLREMDSMGIILDVTHLCDEAFWQALDYFKGPVWASHNNCRALVNHNRQFSDDQIRALIERGAVIGNAMDAWMVVPGWVRKVSDPVTMHCNLDACINHIDHICQLSGNAAHVALGTDLDGGFGREQCPYDLRTIADLSGFPERLKARGYRDADVQAIMHGNALAFLRKAWA